MSSVFVPPTVPGAAGYPLGLTGATAATRYVGGTTSGAPVAGTFAVGDFIIDRTGKVYVCTVAGSPGTWTQAGGGGGGLVALADSTLGADAASFDTNTLLGGNIPSTYSALQIILDIRGTTAANTTGAKLTFNNDSSAVYSTRWTYAGTVASVFSETGATSAYLADVYAANATAGLSSALTMFVPNYTGTAFQKKVSSLVLGSVALNQLDSLATECRWGSTSAITRIAIAPTAGNWLAGSRFTLWGMAAS